MSRIKIIFIVLLLVMSSKFSYAVQSTITEAEGYSCLGDDKTKRQTEQAAAMSSYCRIHTGRTIILTAG